MGQQHALVHVEGPAVVAGKPGHVGWIGHDQQLDALALHGAARLGDAPGVFVAAEVELYVGHGAWRSSQA
jgi:hypothetical protein